MPSSVWELSLVGQNLLHPRYAEFQLAGPTREAFQRFISRTNGERIANGETPPQRQSAIDRAEKRAAELGV